MKKLLFGFVVIVTALVSAGGEIAVPDRATVVETTAARELAAALQLITGEAWDVKRESEARDATYFVGETSAAGKLAAANGWKAYACDEIRRGTIEGKIVLAGDAARGVLYSVDAFLEDVAGVRWWTSGESDYPKKPNWRPRTLAAYRYAPPFRFRETFYRSTLTDPDFKVRAKVNTTSYTRYIIPPTEEKFIPDEKGGNHKLVFFKGRRSAYHSFFQVIPPAKYFKDHPEWFSLVKGERKGLTGDCGSGGKFGGQLCLSNDEMLREYVRETKRLLRENPDCDSIQVAQNDWNGDWCECEKCRAVYDREGAVAGAYVDFANRVAEAIEDEFPNVTIDTFAYMFTRKAPKSVRPRHNVVVRLCDIECAFNRPLADPTYAENKAFLADLQAWSKVAAGNLYIWDYQADFSSYMMPHPNLHVFADNLRLFRDAGAVGVFEQGDAMCVAGDFAALKCYVTSHLMWDPSRDWRALTDEFLKGYYGTAAAPHLKEVLRLASESASRPDAPAMGCYHDEPFPWLTPEVGCRALAEMDAAERAAATQSETFVRRVRLAKLGWDHARIRAWDKWGQTGSRKAAVAAFTNSIARFGIDAYRETVTKKTLDDYLARMSWQPDTARFQREIDRVAAAGGGRVVVPKGVHSCGTLYLKSNVELHLEEGAVLLGGEKPFCYDDAIPEREVYSYPGCATNTTTRKAFIYAGGATNIAITGKGVIDSQGQKFFDHSTVLWERFWAKPPCMRPRMVVFTDCRGIRLEETTFKDCPVWTLWLKRCADITISRIRIEAEPKMINSDGIDFDGCRNVRMGDSVVSTGDDCLVLRAIRGGAPDGIPVVCENIVVSNCVLSTPCQGVRVGCPSDDTIRNAVFRDIVFTGKNGIYIDQEPQYLEGDNRGRIRVSNMLFENWKIDSYGFPISVVAHKGVVPGDLGNLIFRNIDIRSKKPIAVKGNAETTVHDITLEDIRITTTASKPLVTERTENLQTIRCSWGK